MKKIPALLSVDELLRNPFIRLRVAVMVGTLLLGFGTLGYWKIEHFSVLDAVYMTVITLSTVGYETVHPLDVQGKIFTIVLIILGIGTIAWVFSSIIEVFVSENAQRIRWRKRMNERLAMLNEHYIVCGFGRIGQEIVQAYRQQGVPFVVVEMEPVRLKMLIDADVVHVEGDATDDAILERAGIARARALVAVTPTDAVNTFIVLSARGLRPDLIIVSRSDSQQNEAKLYRAGASKVVSAHVLGGRWMSITTLNPAVTEFITAMTELDRSDYLLHEFVIEQETTFARTTFGESNIKVVTGVLIVAIRQAAFSHRFVPNPGDNVNLDYGDILIAIGSARQLSALAKLVRPSHPEAILPHKHAGMR